MSDIEKLRYAHSHEWVRTETDGHITVGITDHAQDQLGDIVFVELPEIGKLVGAGDVCMVVESVKSASEIHMPLKGKVIAVNEQLDEEPELINSAPYEEGWLFKVMPDEDSQDQALLSYEQYQESLNL